VPDLHRLPLTARLSGGSILLGAHDGRVATLARVIAARINLWLPVVLWAGLIFALSSIPSLGTGLGTWDLVLRKLAHFAEYAVLGGLLQRAVGREPLAILLGSAYAVTDELHQSFVTGRQGAPLDWLVDTLGVAAGVLLFSRWVGSRS
jgi:VanZ family protein